MGEVFRAVVDDVREQRRVAGRAVWQLLLSETRFREGDQGRLMATSRTGNRLELRVLRVEAEQGGRLWHVVDKPLGIETEVEGRVDDAAARVGPLQQM